MVKATDFKKNSSENNAEVVIPESGKMGNKPTKATRPLQMQVPEEVKRKFKLMAYENGVTMPEFFAEIVEFYSKHRKES